MNGPASYATADEARAYVGRVLSARRPAGRPAPVYLIVPSSMTKGKPWPKVRDAVGRLVPGCVLLEYRDVFGAAAVSPSAEDRIPVIAARAGGAVVVPRVLSNHGDPRYLIGYAARFEADALSALGCPVLVFSPGGMVAWPDVLVRQAADPAPAFSPLEVVFPAAGGAMLPTTAASYKAIGTLPPPKDSGTRRPPVPPRPAGRRGKGSVTAR